MKVGSGRGTARTLLLAHLVDKLQHGVFTITSPRLLRKATNDGQCCDDFTSRFHDAPSESQSVDTPQVSCRQKGHKSLEGLATADQFMPTKEFWWVKFRLLFSTLTKIAEIKISASGHISRFILSLPRTSWVLVRSLRHEPGYAVPLRSAYRPEGS